MLSYMTKDILTLCHTDVTVVAYSHVFIEYFSLQLASSLANQNIADSPL